MKPRAEFEQAFYPPESEPDDKTIRNLNDASLQDIGDYFNDEIDLEKLTDRQQKAKKIKQRGLTERLKTGETREHPNELWEHFLKQEQDNTKTEADQKPRSQFYIPKSAPTLPKEAASFENQQSYGGRAERFTRLRNAPPIYKEDDIAEENRIAQFELEQERSVLKESKILDEGLLYGFLNLLKEYSVPVSIPEWLTFVEQIKKRALLQTKTIPLNELYTLAKVTLLKHHADETNFNVAFDEFFLQKKRVLSSELIPDIKSSQKFSEEGREIKRKEKLNIREVDEQLVVSQGRHNDEETVHGGKEDQHNDILSQQDALKIGGGNLKYGQGDPAIHEDWLPSKRLSDENFVFHEKIDSSNKYEVYPSAEVMRDLAKKLQGILKSGIETRGRQELDEEKTIEHLSQKELKFEYKEHKKNKPKLIVFIDVGGTTDKFSPLFSEVMTGMSSGVVDTEFYAFHNMLYGYVWPIKNAKHIEQYHYAKPNGLVEVKRLVNQDAFVVVFGDAQMYDHEVDEDSYPPRDCGEQIQRFTMHGPNCLSLIRQKARSSVWVNPVLKSPPNRYNPTRHWSDIRTEIQQGIGEMHDMSIGGFEDAIKFLVKPKKFREVKSV